ncbi:unnamed protein product [Acanthoscelides obtectus]|uniref:Uncharacterized protein n=1 Tax=Acanthoscelides obtectus TaxID=200917 RepID=A0A9P0KLK0_ACAOB|nr:unnamed protein product [Acanthoscelides obtectus]CAK1638627.1 hypothetical protein AOBTE_LOCUS10711 [Acanthoscelides obtectus]
MPLVNEEIMKLAIRNKERLDQHSNAGAQPTTTLSDDWKRSNHEGSKFIEFYMAHSVFCSRYTPMQGVSLDIRTYYASDQSLEDCYNLATGVHGISERSRRRRRAGEKQRTSSASNKTASRNFKLAFLPPISKKLVLYVGNL